MKSVTNIKGLVLFVVISLFFVAATSAISGTVPLQVETTDEVAIVESNQAEGGEYLEFTGEDRSSGGGGGVASGVVPDRFDFPTRTRNTAFDNVEYQSLPTAELPTTAATNSKIGGPGSYNDPEFGPGRSGGGIEIGSAFRSWCSFSHFGYNDPIVFPGQENVAHLHMFFGNTLTDHNATPDSIINKGGSSCDGGVLNRSSYWIPAMLDGNGNAVVPHWMFLYYKTFRLFSVTPSPPVEEAEVFPKGLQMLNTAKSTDGQPTNNIDFWCGDVHGNIRHATHREFIPDCSGLITQRVRFPYCWDGRLRSDDYSHMVYPIGDYGGGACPATHQRRIPHIEFQLTYSVPGGTNTSNWHLSSDVNPVTGELGEGGRTMHGDWFNGWNPTINAMWNKNCTQRLWDCGQGGLLPDRTRLNFHNRNYQNTSPDRYLIPVSELTKLCPGDTDANTVDISYCSSALAANPDALAEHMEHHGHGDAIEGNVAGDTDTLEPHDHSTHVHTNEVSGHSH